MFFFFSRRILHKLFANLMRGKVKGSKRVLAKKFVEWPTLKKVSGMEFLSTCTVTIRCLQTPTKTFKIAKNISFFPPICLHFSRFCNFYFYKLMWSILGKEAVPILEFEEYCTQKLFKWVTHGCERAKREDDVG